MSGVALDVTPTANIGGQNELVNQPRHCRSEIDEFEGTQQYKEEERYEVAIGNKLVGVEGISQLINENHVIIKKIF